MRTESFQLNYQKAEDLQKLLSDTDQRILSKRGSAVDRRAHQHAVRAGHAGRLEEVRRLIQQLDVPVRQVMIESRIVEATDKFGRKLGARLGYHDIGTGTTGFSDRLGQRRRRAAPCGGSRSRHRALPHRPDRHDAAGVQPDSCREPAGADRRRERRHLLAAALQRQARRSS